MATAGQMRLTVLGKSPSWQDAGGACSGYLVEAAGVALLLDCGHGVLAELRRRREPGRVDAVVLSHMHPDHVFDLVPYAYALTVAPRASARTGPRLLLPPGGAAIVHSIEQVFSVEGLLDEAFSLEQYDPAQAMTIGPLEVSFQAVSHYVPAWAIAVEGGGRRLVFGADTGPSEYLIAFARGADLLMLEATLQDPAPAAQGRGHLTAREAGEHARAAGARRLLLTHFSDELDSLATRRDGAAGLGRQVELARAGAVYVV